MLDAKLQLKPGQTIAYMGKVMVFNIAAKPAEILNADAVLAFTPNEAALRRELSTLQYVASLGKLVRVAYPKAGQLGADINRDSIRAIANDKGLDPVRQISMDAIWSALRLKALPGGPPAG